ncbi:MAG: enolase C-terminal domain-like protein [Candidatus Latescibacterota bacterium]|nr:enolase C-terminal domain-like protein [Candidatus Latescibacterota bacterium]
MSFKHHSAERNVTQTVIIVAETSAGAVGVGEGCPREYVTGEDLKSCQCFLNTCSNDIRKNIHSIEDLRNWVEQHQALIDKNPAAWCALELAILDILAKEAKLTVEQLLCQPAVSGRYGYSAVVGDGDSDKVASQIRRYADLGFKDFKLKISGDFNYDNEKFCLIKDLVPTARLRLDGNNIWQSVDQGMNYLEALEIDLFAVEEPLQVMDFSGMEELAQALDIRIIVDESATNIKQIEALKALGDIYIINIRVSKMGGILRSLCLADAAVACGIPLIIGSHVGETSVLTRAGITVSSAYSHHVIAMEGAFGTYLLESDIVNDSLQFGAEGFLNAEEVLDKGDHGFQLEFCMPTGSVRRSFAV